MPKPDLERRRDVAPQPAEGATAGARGSAAAAAASAAGPGRHRREALTAPSASTLSHLPARRSPAVKLGSKRPSRSASSSVSPDSTRNGLISSAV